LFTVLVLDADDREKRFTMNSLKKLREYVPLAKREDSSLAAYATALVSGALLGGIALALFNRKTIQSLQRELHEAPPPVSTDEIY
jgi:hypothetical protein